MTDIRKIPDYLAEIARAFKQRAEGLADAGIGLGKGKRSADAALHFFIGATVGLRLAGQPKRADHVGMVAAMLIATRGLPEVIELANGLAVPSRVELPEVTTRFLAAVAESLTAWDGEEESVKEEHAPMIAELDAAYDAFADANGLPSNMMLANAGTAIDARNGVTAFKDEKGNVALAALKEALERVEYDKPETFDDAEHESNWRAMVQRLRDAIAWTEKSWAAADLKQAHDANAAWRAEGAYCPIPREDGEDGPIVELASERMGEGSHNADVTAVRDFLDGEAANDGAIINGYRHDATRARNAIAAFQRLTGKE